MSHKAGLLLSIIFIITGCSTPAATAISLPSITNPPASTATKKATQTPFPTAIPAFTATATQAPTPPAQICSPLEGIRLDQLPQLMAGDVFNPPAPGRDDGHHGVDFAFYRFGNLITMLGLPVQAILPGKVAAVIDNEKPYGNAIIIETPLEAIPSAGWATIKLPAQLSTVQPDPRLTCPPPGAAPWMAATGRSIYHLYAHLNKLPALKVGDSVKCGQVIGEVGTTGNSVNPHLHLETRIGPAGATFTGMGHYDTRLSEEDRSNYCTWRVSGWFQMFDPMQLLTAQP